MTLNVMIGGPPRTMTGWIVSALCSDAEAEKSQRETTTPQGDLPTATLVSTLRLDVSIIVTSFDGPFAV
jgi:hypothetical protein